MGAYAVPSNQPFIAKQPIKTKRQKTSHQKETENLLELLKGAEMKVDSKTKDIIYIRDGKVIAVFKDDET
jgi:hypothetical protein